MQLTSTSARRGRGHRARAELGRERPRAGRRAVPDRTSAAPASRSAQTAARALPPAPSTSARRRRRSRGSAASEAGRVGVVGRDRAVRAEGQRVGRADRPRALGRRRRPARARPPCAGSSRWRRGSPPRRAARARSRRTAPAGPAAAGSSSSRRPSAASAAACIAGERGGPTGQPRTPRRRIATSAASSATCRPRPGAGLRCSAATSAWNFGTCAEKTWRPQVPGLTT